MRKFPANLVYGSVVYPLKIGLFGGSFNPAHEGHLYISEQALRQLGLDQVWWLVSPQNPLKSAKGMAPFSKRFDSAQKIASKNPKIMVSDIETQLGTTYSWPLIQVLLKRNKRAEFTWLMGADNWEIFHKWMNWRDILESLPVAIFPRPGVLPSTSRSIAARIYKSARLFKTDGVKYTLKDAPKWTYMNFAPHGASSTAIREKVSGKWWD